MASDALEALIAALGEINALQRANPSPQAGGGLTRPEVVRALGRAAVVLLSGHLEAYLYALNREAVECVLGANVDAGLLPLELRLVHARYAIDDLAGTSWGNRADGVRDYSRNEAAIWLDDAPVARLVADRLMTWMKAPSWRNIERFFKMWQVPEIFAAITRSPVGRQRLLLRIEELVSKRNNIAHGDLTVEARPADIAQYKRAVREFSERVDRRMARRLAALTGAPRPW
jgi:RiboL-PSP-HEPN